MTLEALHDISRPYLEMENFRKKCEFSVYHAYPTKALEGHFHVTFHLKFRMEMVLWGFLTIPMQQAILKIYKRNAPKVTSYYRYAAK